LIEYQSGKKIAAAGNGKGSSIHLLTPNMLDDLTCGGRLNQPCAGPQQRQRLHGIEREERTDMGPTLLLTKKYYNSQTKKLN
jgi:hypothetical protein